MVTCQSSELGWEVTVELPADFLSLGRGSVKKYPIFGLRKRAHTSRRRRGEEKKRKKRRKPRKVWIFVR